MRKLLLIPLSFLSSVTVADDVVVSPSSDFQSYLDGLNSSMIGFLDYYLLDYQGYIQYISEVLASGQDSLQSQNIEQTEKIQSLINNVIDYIEPQLEELRANSTDEIVPDLKSLLQSQKNIEEDVDDLSTVVNDGMNDLTISLENINKSQEAHYEEYNNNNQQQKEYYNSLESALNTLQQTLTDDVGANLFGISDNVEEIRHKIDYLSTEGTSVAILNTLIQNGLKLEDWFNSFGGALNGGYLTNSFPKEILEDYKAIDRDGDTLELGWKLSDDANTFTPGNINLSHMDPEKISGGYFEQILKYLNVNTKVDIESKETLLAILKSIPVDDENREKEAKDFVSDVEDNNRQALQDESSAVETADGIEFSDNDKYKQQLNKLKDITSDLVNSSSLYKDLPSSLYLSVRAAALGEGEVTYTTSFSLPPSLINFLNVINSSMPWIYGLFVFGFLSSFFFYLLGILYRIIINYKVV